MLNGGQCENPKKNNKKKFKIYMLNGGQCEKVTIWKKEKENLVTQLLLHIP